MSIISLRYFYIAANSVKKKKRILLKSKENQRNAIKWQMIKPKKLRQAVHWLQAYLDTHQVKFLLCNNIFNVLLGSCNNDQMQSKSVIRNIGKKTSFCKKKN